MVILALKILILCIPVLGIMTGIFISFKNRKSNYILSAAIFFIILSYDYLVFIYEQFGFATFFPQLLFTNWAIPLLYGPIIFMICMKIVDREIKLKFLHLIYFLLFFIMVYLQSPVIFNDSASKLNMLIQFKQNGIQVVATDMDWMIQVVHNTIFLILSVRLLFNIYLMESVHYLKSKFLKASVLLITATYTSELLILVLNLYIPVSYLHVIIFYSLLWIGGFLFLVGVKRLQFINLE